MIKEVTNDSSIESYSTLGVPDNYLTTAIQSLKFLHTDGAFIDYFTQIAKGGPRKPSPEVRVKGTTLVTTSGRGSRNSSQLNSHMS